MSYKLRTYSSITDQELRRHPGIQSLSAAEVEELEIMEKVFPFRVNNFLLDHLIDWNSKEDPIRRMLFPRQEMLVGDEFELIKHALQSNSPKLNDLVATIRARMNPHPAGQRTLNVPHLKDGTPLSGVQHQYSRTVLFFPRQAQTCHAYCSFCFRWPQFVGDPQLRIETNEINPLIKYLQEHPEVTDILITGGDPLVMNTALLRQYIEPLLLFAPHIKSIRLGTKALSYWPMRFFSDKDSSELIEFFKEIPQRGKALTIVSHITHPHELENQFFERAAETLSSADCDLKVQTPLMRGINDQPSTLARLWAGCHKHHLVPYYLYVARDTGAQHFFGIPLVKTLAIYNTALQRSCGLVGTVRGPVMSTEFGKIQIVGDTFVGDQKALVLKMVQARDPQFAGSVFLAEYNENALWLSDLKPLGGADKFPFEQLSRVPETRGFMVPAAPTTTLN